MRSRLVELLRGIEPWDEQESTHLRDEFSAIRWLTPSGVLSEPIDTMDPHMHRFVHKLLAVWK